MLFSKLFKIDEKSTNLKFWFLFSLNPSWAINKPLGNLFEDNLDKSIPSVSETSSISLFDVILNTERNCFVFLSMIPKLLLPWIETIIYPSPLSFSYKVIPSKSDLKYCLSTLKIIFLSKFTNGSTLISHNPTFSSAT